MDPIVSMRAAGSRRLADLLPDCVAAISGGGGRLAAVDAAVVVLVDGLGHENLAERAAHARTIRGAGKASAIGVFPSTTAAAILTATSGLLPGEHGVVGYEQWDSERGRVVNQLHAFDGIDAPDGFPPGRTVFERAVEAGGAGIVVGPRSFAGSGFTRTALRGAEYRGANRLGDRVDAAVEAARRGSLVLLYVPELDRVAHRSGWRSAAWSEALEDVDGMVRDLVRRLPARSGVLVTADHGMVDVPERGKRLVGVGDGLLDGVDAVAGEPRMRHLHLADPAGADALAASWSDAVGQSAWVFTRRQLLDAGAFGTVAPGVAERIGDVVVAARGTAAFYDGRGRPDPALGMIGQHGSMTDAELRVPALAFGAFSG